MGVPLLDAVSANTQHQHQEEKEEDGEQVFCDVNEREAIFFFFPSVCGVNYTWSFEINVYFLFAFLGGLFGRDLAVWSDSECEAGLWILMDACGRVCEH